MAANKREEWEIERDREEIASLLARHRRISHQRIADLVNANRSKEFQRATQETSENLSEHDSIPDIRPPYTLTRQMIDYEVRVLKRLFRKRAGQKFELAQAAHLNDIDELHEAAWDGYERSLGTAESSFTQTQEVTLKGTERVDGEGITREVQIPATKTTERHKREHLIGDPRFLQVVDQALERREKVLGLAPQEVNVNVQPIEVKLVAGFNPSDWDKAKESNDNIETGTAEDATADKTK